MNFKHKIPREYAENLYKFLGEPTLVGDHVIGWENTPFPYTRIEVKDEFIAHNFPSKHHDFVYSYTEIPVSPDIACKLNHVSGSILIDLLKGEVGARCGGLTANDVTLSFVKDVIKNPDLATKKEYARRIKNKIITHKNEFDLAKKFDLFLSTNNNSDCILV